MNEDDIYIPPEHFALVGPYWLNFERALKRAGGVGETAFDQIKSIEHLFPRADVNAMHWLRLQRNGVSHYEGWAPLENPTRFEREAKHLIALLETHHPKEADVQSGSTISKVAPTESQERIKRVHVPPKIPRDTPFYLNKYLYCYLLVVIVCWLTISHVNTWSLVWWLCVLGIAAGIPIYFYTVSAAVVVAGVILIGYVLVLLVEYFAKNLY